MLLGLNGASIVRGLRFGPGELVNACHRGVDVIRPMQGQVQKQTGDALKSIPEISLDEILGEREAAVTVRVIKYEDGMMPSREAMALLAILAAEHPKEVLEIGTYMGHTTRAMAENLPGSVIHTVDLPPDFESRPVANGSPPKDDFHLIERRQVGREFNQRTFPAQIVQHFGDTATMDFQNLGKPTFFFIDGSHTYEYCKQDSEKCFALCGGKGTFLWHDCDEAHPGVIQFVLEWRALGRNIVRIRDTAIAYWKS